MPATLRTRTLLVQFFDQGGLYFWNRRTRETTRQRPARVTVVWFGLMDEEGDNNNNDLHKEARVSTYVLPPLPG